MEVQNEKTANHGVGAECAAPHRLRRVWDTYEYGQSAANICYRCFRDHDNANGNEYASEEATPGQDEKSGASDAAPGQVTEKDSSAGDEKPAVGKTPARENGASAPSKAGPAGGESSDSAGSSSSKPAGNSPSVPAGNEPSTPAGSGTDAAETPAPQPEEKVFDMDYWLGYAKDYAVGIGLRLDENAADSWDTPIRCSSKTEDVLAAYIRDDLTYYKNEEGCTAVWIWAEQVGDGQYELFIGRG